MIPEIGVTIGAYILVRFAPPGRVRSPNNEAAQVTRSNRGSIRTVLGYGFVIAKNSSLEREFIAAVHRSCGFGG